ncbi:MAG: CDP-diacylglycerol--serine O-phosphatidyltransferase [Eubacteriales bacterium]|nr:CDP-diacylglycerol--serine O-phosphatidyltransferase [Eubacteriales bacterium]MDD4769051.1 CDP-diacylglycerol--serine O-phosphatidyltransferase [Eubacteriales bacterium]
MLRIKKIVPSLCTLANLIFGLISLVFIYNGRGDWAAVFIVMGMLFDGFDGRLARLLKVSSEFGKQLDSLSDLVTFGVAPAMLAYAVSLKQLGEVWGILAMLPFPLMGALRLARFNALTSGQGFFVGVPITLAGGLMALFLLCSPDHSVWLVLAVLLLLSWLMISTFRYPDFKSVGIPKFVVLFIVVVLVGAVIFLRWRASAFFMVPLVIYMLLGIKNYLVDLWQKRKKARAS